MLQKSVSGEWVYVESWEESNDTSNTSVAETYQVSHDTYRVIMTCGADGETETMLAGQSILTQAGNLISPGLIPRSSAAQTNF